jgi:hypothetical protein
MQDLASIHERNQLRREAHLPLLDVGVELARMQQAELETALTGMWTRPNCTGGL